MNSETHDQKTRILVVEDESIVAKDIQNRLVSMGYEVPAVFSRGEDAVEKAPEIMPDLVLMDIVLNGKMNGIEAACIISSDLRIPVVFLTAYADKETLDKAKLSQPFGYIVKPFDNGELQSTIEMALYKHDMEKKLIESHEWFSTTLMSIGDAVIATDTEGNVSFMNNVAEALTRWKEEDAVGRYIEEVFNIVNESTGEKVEGPVAKVLKDSIVVGLSKHSMLIARDGTRIPIDDSGAPILDKERKIIGVVLVFRDISNQLVAEKERLALERQLEQSRKMEAVGTLAGGIAHDFNNILSPIFGYLHLAMMKIPEDSELAEYLKKVYEAADRAREMVNEILSFSRRDTQNISDIEVHVIVKEALKLLRASIPTTIEIRQDIDPHCGSVLANPTQIHQIVMNICTNAYYAMRETGGILGVSLVPLEISSMDFIKNINLKPGPYLRLEISDTGHGMDQAVRERIFEPYFTTKDKGEGTGMGLSIVHGLVKGIGGYVTVYSEPGKGTAFHIYLPVIESSVSRKEAPDKTTIPTGTERILLVDDEEQVREVEKKMLSSLGYEVKLFSCPLKALENIIAQPDFFDLVITDMTMPKMTGDKLAREIKAIRPAMPVILCTGFSDLVDEATAKAMGISAYLTKPIFGQTFAETVRNVLDGEVR